MIAIAVAVVDVVVVVIVYLHYSAYQSKYFWINMIVVADHLFLANHIMFWISATR